MFWSAKPPPPDSVPVPAGTLTVRRCKSLNGVLSASSASPTVGSLPFALLKVIEALPSSSVCVPGTVTVGGSLTGLIAMSVGVKLTVLTPPEPLAPPSLTVMVN